MIKLFLGFLRDFTLLKKTAGTFFGMFVQKCKLNAHYTIKATRWIYCFLRTSGLCRISIEGTAVPFYTQLHKNSTAHL